MPGLDKEEGCVVQFSHTCVYFRSFPRSRLTWVNNCEEGTPTGSFPNHKGFIKSSAAAEIMTHNYLISGIFVIWLDLQLWRSPGVRTWKTIQLNECNDLKWNLLWDPSELIAGKWSLLFFRWPPFIQQPLRESFSGSWPAGPSCSELKAGTGCTSTVTLREDHLWCHDGVSPALRPELMFSFSSKRIEGAGIFHIISLYIFIFIFFISHKRCFWRLVPARTHSVFHAARQRGHLVSGLEDWEDLSVVLVCEPCRVDYEII